MPYRRRRTRVTLGKDPRRMARTVLRNLTAGTIPAQIQVALPTVAADVTNTGDVFENADTENIVSTSAVIKYVNIRVELSIRPETAPANPGWYEYALVMLREQQSTSPNIDSAYQTNVGTETIGTMAINLNRGKCLWNGAVAVASEQPQVLDLKVKMPARYCKWQRGDNLVFISFFRSNNSTDTTSSLREIYSHQFKVYT